MADEIVNQECAAAHPQSFVGEASQLCRLQVVGEQAAADEVEARVREGKCESVGHHRPVLGQQVRAQAIEVSYVERDPLTRYFAGHGFWDFTESGCHFEHREMLETSDGGDAFDQAARGGDAAKPAVDAAQVAQGNLDLAWR